MLSIPWIQLILVQNRDELAMYTHLLVRISILTLFSWWISFLPKGHWHGVVALKRVDLKLLRSQDWAKKDERSANVSEKISPQAITVTQYITYTHLNTCGSKIKWCESKSRRLSHLDALICPQNCTLLERFFDLFR